MEEIDLRDFFNYFKKSFKYFILIFLAVIIAGSIYTFFVQKPLYQSRATIILGSDQKKTITQNEININKNLVETYAEVVKSHRVLDRVKQSLASESTEDVDPTDYDFAKLTPKISVSALKGTEIIEIKVTDKNPQTAQNIANTTSEVFVEEVSKLYNIENAKILDHGLKPEKPYNINPIHQEIIFALAGIILATGVIFTIYYFDRTIKTAEQIEKQLKLPFIGKIRKIKTSKKATKKELAESDLIIKTNPKSRISEDFRTLRTNLHFLLNSNDSKTLLITSTDPGEGKSFVSSNLAIAFAQTGKNVLLIDADMHVGRLHEIFKVSNNSGLSNLLADHKSSDYPDYVRNTKIKNLSLITRGNIPPNPSELLDSADMDRLLNKTKVKFDYIIIDGTPLKDLSDSIILAKKVKRVSIVCCSNRTTSEDIITSKKSLENVNANIAGVILNQITESNKKDKYNKYYQND